MADQSTLYDLVLLLSPDAPEQQRAKVLSDVEAAIGRAGGSVERDDNWGRRPMAYQIRHQPEAEYHLLQFSAPGTLIEELSHTLHITDGVVRFRVIKVRPGTPAAPSSPPPVVAGATAGTSSGPAATAGTSSAPAATPAASPPPPADASAADGEQNSESDTAAAAAAEVQDTEPE